MTEDSDKHNKKIVTKLLKKFERLAKKGKDASAIIPDTGVSVACNPNKVAISWPNILRYHFLVDHVESLGYVPGKHDLKGSLFNRRIDNRQFVKELYS